MRDPHLFGIHAEDGTRIPGTANNHRWKGFSAALAFGSILVLYFVLSCPLTKLGQRVEARLAVR